MENIKKLRLLNKKSQKEIAEKMNISAAAYFKYETGDSKPTIENLCKLADIYDVSVDYLVGRNIDDFGYLSAQERALIESFRRLNEVNQIKVSSYALGVLATQEN